MRIDKDKAIESLRNAAEQTEAETVSNPWIRKIEEFSELCEGSGGKTHIAFLGTAILAKTVNEMADLFAIKPTHARGNPHAFSARSLCHNVLVPLSAELGFSIGVTGREPLNNQPYFRMTYLGDGTPVHENSRVAFDYMLELVEELNAASGSAAQRALSAFIEVRKKRQVKYSIGGDIAGITPLQLTEIIRQFVLRNSENGRRAQAVVAGLLDTFAGPERVASGRVNDPSRKYPGDVCVQSINDPSRWEKAIEVRDKPVKKSDAQIFGRKCIEMDVQEAALVMVSENQPNLDGRELDQWAHQLGLGLTLFYGWEVFVDQVMYWSTAAKPVSAVNAVSFIRARLIEVEVASQSVSEWDKAVKDEVCQA